MFSIFNNPIQQTLNILEVMYDNYLVTYFKFSDLLIVDTA